MSLSANSETITKALVIASQVDSRQQLNNNGVGNESATGVRLGIKDIAGQCIANSKALGDTLQIDSAQQLNCNATGNKSANVGDLGQDKELVKQSSGIKKKFATDGDKRIAQCDALWVNTSVVQQYENMEIVAASNPVDLQAENSSSEDNASGNWTVIAHKKISW